MATQQHLDMDWPQQHLRHILALAHSSFSRHQTNVGMQAALGEGRYQTA